MGYALGLDLGTTFTAAAINRNGRAEMVSLGNRASVIPSLVFLREDEEILVGDAAERRGTSDPRRLAREFKRRLGDSAPIMLGSSPYSAERIMAALMHDVVDSVTEREGEPPDTIAITHPANWGPYKTDLLRQAANLAGLRDAVLLTEPVAAAIFYASNERIETGRIIAVYDLGGGTFDAAVLRKTVGGFEQMGDPEGIERLGGVDFDEAVFRHVREAIGEPFEALDHDDPAVRSATQRLRQESALAKEGLSSDTDASIPVLLPGLQTEIRVTRPEFESMVRPTLRETVEALRRAIASAGVTPTELHSVLLVGGSSRIPLVSEMVSNELGRPVAVDAHPKHAVAMGASIVAAGAPNRSPSARSAGPPDAVIVTLEDLAVSSAQSPATAPPLVPSPAPAAPSPAPAAPSPAPTAPPLVPTTPSITAPTAAGAGAARWGATPPVPPGPPSSGPSGPVGNAAGGGRNSTKTALIVALAAVVFVVAGFAAFTSLTGKDETASPPTTTSLPDVAVTVPVAVTAPPCQSESGRCAFIVDIKLEGEQYVATYVVDAFEPVIYQPGVKGSPGDHHVHFYFDTVGEDHAGTNTQNPGQWVVWDRDSGAGELRFDALGLANQVKEGGEGATQLCSSVADAEHGIEFDSGSCVDLPTGG